MIYLNAFSSDSFEEKNLEKNFAQKGKFVRRIFDFSYSRGMFRAGELTMEWLLFFLKDRQNFLQNYFLEFNEKIPELSDEEMQIFLKILFSDFNNKTPQKNNAKEENMYNDMLLSVSMAVRHIRISYSDIMTMNVSDFYEIMSNIEVIMGTKSMEERTDTSVSEFADSKGLMALKNGIL